MRSIAILLLLLATLPYKKTEAVTPETITGNWIETSAHEDTVIFNPVFQGRGLENALLVNRGGESMPVVS